VSGPDVTTSESDVTEVVMESRMNGANVSFSTTRWIGDKALLGAVLDALASEVRFEPERFGTDERRMKAFSKKAMLSAAPKQAGREWIVLFERDAPFTFQGSFTTTRETSSLIGVQDPSPEAIRAAFDLGDRLAPIVTPEVAAVGRWIDAERPAPHADAETVVWMNAAVGVDWGSLRSEGLVGLAARTYLGPSVVELIGRATIEALPVPVAWQPWGGVRVDLVPEPWSATEPELVEAWKKAMAVLRPSDAFSRGKVNAPGWLAAGLAKRWIDWLKARRG
jgi:hypothetical protein